MSRAYIKCKCGAVGYGTAREYVDTVEILDMPDEWHNENPELECEHKEINIDFVECLHGTESEQDYQASGL